MPASKPPVRATIVDPGKPGYRCGEPVAWLADGRVMPMGWNIGKTYPVGTTGTAQYVDGGSAALWRFTPDPEPGPNPWAGVLGVQTLDRVVQTAAEERRRRS